MQTAMGIVQIEQVGLTNPAIVTEHKRLTDAALAELRAWIVMNPVEKAFNFSLSRATRELVEFEARHGIEGD